jgi:hypothetical protein
MENKEVFKLNFDIEEYNQIINSNEFKLMHKALVYQEEKKIKKIFSKRELVKFFAKENNRTNRYYDNKIEDLFKVGLFLDLRNPLYYKPNERKYLSVSKKQVSFKLKNKNFYEGDFNKYIVRNVLGLKANKNIAHYVIITKNIYNILNKINLIYLSIPLEEKIKNTKKIRENYTNKEINNFIEELIDYLNFLELIKKVIIEYTINDKIKKNKIEDLPLEWSWKKEKLLDKKFTYEINNNIFKIKINKMCNLSKEIYDLFELEYFKYIAFGLIYKSPNVSFNKEVLKKFKSFMKWIINFEKWVINLKKKLNSLTFY